MAVVFGTKACGRTAHVVQTLHRPLHAPQRTSPGEVADCAGHQTLWAALGVGWIDGTTTGAILLAAEAVPILLAVLSTLVVMRTPLFAAAPLFERSSE